MKEKKIADIRERIEKKKALGLKKKNENEIDESDVKKYI